MFAVTITANFSPSFSSGSVLYVGNSSIGAGINAILELNSSGSIVGTIGSSLFNACYANLVFDSNGNLFEANYTVGTILKIAASGSVSTFAAGFNEPGALAFDNSGNLYVANYGGDTVSKVTQGGSVSTFASGLGNPNGLAFDSSGNLYVTCTANRVIVKITPEGSISTFATGFIGPGCLVFDTSGNLYVADQNGSCIRKVTPSGTVSTFASRITQPSAMAFDSSGNLYVSSLIANSSILRITPNGQVSTFATGFSWPGGLVIGPAIAPPPIVTTGSASGVTANSATLNGSVNPNGSSTTAYFQWGTSTAYGNSVPTPAFSCGSANNTIGVSAQNLSGFASSTTYHYRLLANNSVGTAYGADQTFTTLSGAPPSTVSATLSTLMATPSSAPADGSSQITATVTLRDGNNNPVAGKTITFYASEVNASGARVVGSLSIQSILNPTAANGEAAVTITANTAGTVSICAVDAADSVTVQHTATVQFTALPQVVPNSDLASAISSLDSVSQNQLDNVSSLASSIANLGGYFWQQAESAQFDLQIDVAATFEGLATANLFPNDQYDANVAKMMIETVAPSVAEGAAELSPPNFLDTAWINTLSSSPSTQVAQQGMIAHNQRLIAWVWYEEQGSSVSISSLSDSAVQYALGKIYASSGGLESLLASPLSPLLTLGPSLSTRKASLLGGIPPISAAQQTGWANDLLARQGVPFVYNIVISQHSEFLQAMQSLNMSYQNAWLGKVGAEATEDFANGLSLVVGYGPETTLALGAINSFVDDSQLTTFEKTYLSAFNTIESCFDYGDRISLNESGAFAGIIAQMSPQTVTGQIGAPTNNSIGYAGGLLNTLFGSWIELQSYSDIPLTNSSTTEAAFEVYTCWTHTDFFVGLGWQDIPLVTCVRTNLAPGGTATARIYYTQEQQRPASPDAGSTVYMYVLGSDVSGTFYIGQQSTIWPESWLSDPGPANGTNGLPSVTNPISASWTYSASNQSYNVQLWLSNPFDLPLLAVVTQSVPTNITITSTDGTFNGANSVIIWTNLLQPSTNISVNCAFTCPISYGSEFTLPAASLVLEDTNSGATLDATNNAPELIGQSAVQTIGVAPTGISGVGSLMPVTFTNLTDTSETGSLTISLTDSAGNAVTNFTESFSVAGSGSTSLEFTLPGSLPAGSYSLTGSLIINGGTGQVFAGTYVVPSPPLMLNLVSAPALTTNGFSLVLQGPVGNYLIEASSDISNPTNWQPILFYSTTNSPFYYYFTDPAVTNYHERFYRAVIQ
jgi:sugar lactone lactonase YvrE